MVQYHGYQLFLYFRMFYQSDFIGLLSPPAQLKSKRTWNPNTEARNITFYLIGFRATSRHENEDGNEARKADREEDARPEASPSRVYLAGEASICRVLLEEVRPGGKLSSRVPFTPRSFLGHGGFHIAVGITGHGWVGNVNWRKRLQGCHRDVVFVGHLVVGLLGGQLMCGSWGGRHLVWTVNLDGEGGIYRLVRVLFFFLGAALFTAQPRNSWAST
jgi:hypothetical protein